MEEHFELYPNTVKKELQVGIFHPSNFSVFAVFSFSLLKPRKTILA